jgi:hypothetical protein
MNLFGNSPSITEAFKATSSDHEISLSFKSPNMSETSFQRTNSSSSSTTEQITGKKRSRTTRPREKHAAFETLNLQLLPDVVIMDNFMKKMPCQAFFQKNVTNDNSAYAFDRITNGGSRKSKKNDISKLFNGNLNSMQALKFSRFQVW